MEPSRSQKLTDIKQRIVSFIRIHGPVLPVHAAKETGISMLFASAFLSELVSEKTLKMSYMRVGGSPLYFLPGQETQVERFYSYLPGKEKEAYNLLRQSKILRDDKQEPAIRVALRSIKDFAIPFKIESYEEIYWRFFSVSEQEAIKEVQIIKLREPGIKQEIKPEIKPEVKIEIKQIIKPEQKEEIKQEIKPEIIKVEEKPLVKVKPLLRIKKEKVSPTEFLNDVKEFLIRKDIELVQVIFYDKKEVMCKVRINSDLGKISFLLVAKDKKRVAESDLISAYQKAINEKMPCYFLAKGELSDKTKEHLEIYKNLLKVDILK